MTDLLALPPEDDGLTDGQAGRIILTVPITRILKGTVVAGSYFGMSVEDRKTSRTLGVVMAIFGCIFAAGCDRNNGDTGWQSGEPLPKAPPVEAGATLTFGDIDPDTPMYKISRMQPLADHLAMELGWDPARVTIRIARSVEEMATMIVDGQVDIYMDSLYPTLLVRELAETRLFLSLVVENQRSYHALVVGRATSDLNTLDQLVGRTIAAQEGFSTSGYLLPIAMLIERGYRLQRLNGPEPHPAPDAIGFFFSGDEENTVAMIRNGAVPAGTLSSEDYDDLPRQVRDELRVLARTEEVPRKIASIRSDLDPALVGQVREILLAITEDDRERMIEETPGRGWRWEFESIQPATEAGIERVQTMIGTISELEAGG